MKEKTIGNKTAKLAIEKGFNIISKSGKKYLTTQSLLQKWLREKHRIYVHPIPDFKTGWNQHSVGILFKNKKNEVDAYIPKDNYGIPKIFNSFESAMECGLFEGLKLITRGNK